MRALYRLTARGIQKLNDPGRYADGHLLFLQVRRIVNGNRVYLGKSWIMRFHAPNGRVREIGLGSALKVSLKEAREARDAAYALLRNGVDPLRDRETKRAVANNARTFGDFTDEYLKTALTGFRNEKHKWQWRQTLEKHAKPIWKRFLQDITTDDVAACLDPIWDTRMRRRGGCAAGSSGCSQRRRPRGLSKAKTSRRGPI